MVKRFFLTMMMTAATCLAFASCTSDPSDKPGLQEDENPSEPVTPPDGQKVLVAYYSHTGNTRQIAGYIHEAVESDLFAIEVVNPYPEDYDEHLAQARREVAEGYLPPLSTQIEDMAQYDIVFVGYPIWVNTAASPIASFLSGYDLSGKTVIPFCTSGTSSAEASYQLVRRLCPDSDVKEGIQIQRGTYDTAHERVLDWLRGLGMIQ